MVKIWFWHWSRTSDLWRDRKQNKGEKVNRMFTESLLFSVFPRSEFFKRRLWNIHPGPSWAKVAFKFRFWTNNITETMKTKWNILKELSNKQILVLKWYFSSSSLPAWIKNFSEMSSHFRQILLFQSFEKNFAVAIKLERTTTVYIKNCCLWSLVVV